ncbi:MAG: MinD/ParA family ATP-binding protein [Streptomycetales bacterium]
MSGQGNEPEDHTAPPPRSPLEEELARMGLSYGTSYIRPVPGPDAPAGDDPTARDPQEGVPLVDETVVLDRESFQADPRIRAGGGEPPPVRGGEPPPRREARPRPRSAESPTADTTVPVGQQAPSAGWRRGVRVATAGVVRLGLSREQSRQHDLEARVAAPIAGCYRIGVLALKGGVGKTTTVACLGATFASLRGDRVIAVDANPDRGTLGDRMPRETDRTVRDLLSGRRSVVRYEDVRAFTSRGPSRLEVLPSAADPGLSTPFGEADYRAVVDTLERFYSLVLTDCGTGILHSAMNGVLGVADALVVVGSPSLDGARSASAALDWLEAHGYRRLLGRSVAVISPVLPQSPYVDVGKLAQHLAARCHAVVRLPFDPHLATGPVIDLASMKAETRWSYLQFAAALADGFRSGR